MARFKVGDKVWAAHFNHNEQVRVPCYICYGTLKVTLRLGNGEEVELPCDYCGKGNWGNPTGYEIEYKPVSEPEFVLISGMNITVNSKGEQAEYWNGADSCHRIYSEDKLFESREEAEAKSKELMEEWLNEQRTRAEYIKADVKKTFAWNAGYHLRYAKKLEKDIEDHREKAKLCKERSKEG